MLLRYYVRRSEYAPAQHFRFQIRSRYMKFEMLLYSRYVTIRMNHVPDILNTDECPLYRHIIYIIPCIPNTYDNI